MKNFKSLLPFLLMLFVWAGCDTDDLRNNVDELENRIESLEAQVSAINDNMNAIRVILDGTKTISSYTLENGTYTLKLSDGSEITLSQGNEGQIVEPDITINENGEWVLNDKVIGQATGNDGITPKFNISADKYWQISLDGGVTYDYVLDVNNKKVPATTGGDVSVSDAFFKEVNVKGDMLEVTLKDGETYSLPIVADLKAQIVDPAKGFKDGVWTIGYGETVTTEVEISGDNSFVTVPAGGWTATLSEVKDGKATLTVTAPAQASVQSRATADNSTELVLQVNKGINWAIDKIKVEAKLVVASYKALYDADQAINVNGVEISKAMFGEACSIESDTEISKLDYKVYFVKPGATLTYNAPTSVSAKSLIVIGDNSADQTAKVVLKNRIQLNMGSSPAESDGYYVFYNVNFDASSTTTPALLAYKNDVQDKAIVFDNCNLTLGNKNFFELTTDGRYFNSLTIKNSKVKLNNSMYLVHIDKNTSTKFGNLSLVNNVFYAEAVTSGNGFKIFNSTNATSSLDKLVLNNNTFVNVCPNWSGMYYQLSLGTVDLQNNLFWASTLPANGIILRPGNTKIAGTVCKHNVGFSLNANTNTWIAFFGFDDNKFEGAENIINIKAESTESAENPFVGGTFDLSTGTFVPNATYAEYGAKFE